LQCRADRARDERLSAEAGSKAGEDISLRELFSGSPEKRSSARTLPMRGGPTDSNIAPINN